VRLFLASELDAAAARACGEVLRAARAACGPLADVLRWSTPENLHLTLHFLGTIDDTRVPALVSDLGPSLSESAFDVATGTLGTFSSGGATRTVWLAVAEGVEPLARVHRTLADRLVRAGVPIETRPFHPHLTLARVRDRERRRARGIAARLAAVPAPPIRWTVAEIALIASDLGGPTPRYRRVHGVRLAE
jgi:2'-5' RNA ligase